MSALPTTRPGRVALLVAGLVLTQAVLYGPSLAGSRILLPLDILARNEEYLPRTPEVRATVPHDAVFSDEVEQMEMFRLFAVAEVRQGRLPLWNPYNYCGAPFLAANQSAVFSPFRLPDYVFPGPRTMAWVYLLKAMVAGTGAYLFFRRALSASFWPAAFGGWAYPLSGFLVLWSGYPLSSAAVWLPWVLLGVDAAVRRPRRFGGLGLALATGLTLVSGHLGVSAHVLLAAALYALFVLADVYGPRRAAIPAVLALAGGILLGLLLAAPQLVPTAEYMRSSRRVAGRAQGEVETRPVGFAALPLLAIPDFQGSSRRGRLMLSVNQLESAAVGYAGFFPLLVLAPLAFARPEWRRTAAFFAALAVVCLGQVLDIPVLSWVLASSPLRLLRNNRLPLVSGFAVLALAVLGLEALRQGAVRRRAWFALPAALLGLLGAWCVLRALSPPDILGPGLAAFVSNPANAASLPPSLRNLEDVRTVQRWFLLLNLRGLGLSLLGLGFWGLLAWRPALRGLGAALPAAALAELLLTTWGVHPQTDPALYFPSIPALEAVASRDDGRLCGYRCLPPNLNLRFRLRDVRGYDAADPAALVDLLDLAHDPAAPPSPPHARTQGFVPRASPILSLLGVRYLAFRGAPPPGAPPAFASDDYWVARREALPRAFVPRQVERVPAGEPTLRRMGGGDFDPAHVAFVDGDLGLGDHDGRGTATIHDETPTRLTIDAQMDEAGLVVLTDLYFRGWRALVDGSESQVVRVDHAFRGVVVPPGNHRIEFRYEPQSFAWGVRLMLLAAVAAGSWAFLLLRRAL